MPGSTPTSPAAAAAAAHNKAIQTRGFFLYPKEVIWFLCGILAVATLVNIFSILHRWRRLRRHSRSAAPRSTTSRDLEETSSSQPSTPFHRFLNATLTTSRIIFFRWEVPLWRDFSINVMETAMVLLYCAALMIWEFVFTANLTVNSWSDRAAHLAAIQIPILPALSSKNNIIGWLTGVGHEKINVLHRMISRSILLLVLIHFWGRWKDGLRAKSGDDLSQELWERYGAAAGCLLLVIIIMSFRPFRKASYETFYWLHVALVICFLVTAYLHCGNAGPPTDYTYYIWPAFVVWGVERVLRGLRYLVNNFLLRSRVSPDSFDSRTARSSDEEKRVSTTATPTALPSPTSNLDDVPALSVTKAEEPSRHLARVTLLSPTSLRITLPRTYIRWTPGQHTFLAFPTVSLIPFESHPFTIANVPRALSSSLVNLPSRKGEGEDLEFVVRTRDGMTKRLREQVERYTLSPAQSDGKNETERALVVPVFIDGPYGAAPDVAPYETVVLIAGGTGVSFTLSLLLSAFQKVTAGKALTKRLRFVWATRQLPEIEYITSVIQTAIKDAPTSLLTALSLDVGIYYTGPSGSNPSSSEPSSDASSLSSKIPSSASMTIIKSRPNVHECIQEESSAAVGGEMFVTACGPYSLTSAVRKTLSFTSVAGPRAVMKGGPTITLHVEQFSL